MIIKRLKKHVNNQSIPRSRQRIEIEVERFIAEGKHAGCDIHRVNGNRRGRLLVVVLPLIEHEGRIHNNRYAKKCLQEIQEFEDEGQAGVAARGSHLWISFLNFRGSVASEFRAGNLQRKAIFRKVNSSGGYTER